MVVGVAMMATQEDSVSTSRSIQVAVDAQQRAAGTTVEVEDDGQRVVVEVPAGTPAGAEIKVRRPWGLLRVEICDLDWGLDAQSRLDLAPTAGPVKGDASFWQRATEELLASRRSKREVAGAVYVEQRDDGLVLTGLQRKAVEAPGQVVFDRAWGHLLWHSRPGPLSMLSAFSDSDRKAARRCGRPLISINHTMLSPSTAASVIFPVGMRTLALAAGLNAVLALDRRGQGRSLLLGRAVAARVVYPDGSVAPVEHDQAGLPRELYDRAAFALDESLGEVGRRARRALQEAVDSAIGGRPPGT